jgi:hypothetical protein
MLVQQLDHLLYKSFPNGTPNPNLQGPTFWLWTYLVMDIPDKRRVQ